MKPTLAVIVPAYNAASDLRQCLAAIRGGDEQPAELLVADDGSTDHTAAVARELGAEVIATGGPLGPGIARNLAARHSRAALLVFFDADVVPHRDTVARIRHAFETQPELAAVIGAYDDAPACTEFLSQYKNLQHCFVHRNGARAASTFWTGCGAVRRDVFERHGGFSGAYDRPSIEDIEFGTRLAAAGERILLDPAIQVQHLKRWTLRGLLRTDVFQRAVPWTRLIARQGRLPDDLNLAVHQRMSAALALVSLAAALVGTGLAGTRFAAAALAVVWFALAAFWIDQPRRIATGLASLAAIVPLWVFGRPLESTVWPPAAICAASASIALALNYPFFAFLAGRCGWPFAIACTMFYLLYLIYSAVTFTLVTIAEKLKPSSAPRS